MPYLGVFEGHFGSLASKDIVLGITLALHFVYFWDRLYVHMT